jgi:hypothetical protein
MTSLTKLIMTTVVVFFSLSMPSVEAAFLTNGDFDGPAAEASAPFGWNRKATPDVANQTGPFNNTGAPWALSPNGGTFVRGIGTGNAYQESISQKISGLTIGTTYKLSFYQTNLGFKQAISGEWRNQEGYWGFALDNKLIGISDAVKGPNLPTESNTWIFGSILFTATNVSQLLTIEAFSTLPGRLAYMGIDGIDLSAIPVPAAFWLFGSSLIGLLNVSKFRRAGKTLKEY